MKGEKSMKNNRKPNSQGTQEWSVKTVNCCTGCSQDCIYCYAKMLAIRRNQVASEEWPNEKVRQHDVNKKHRLYNTLSEFIN